MVAYSRMISTGSFAPTTKRSSGKAWEALPGRNCPGLPVRSKLPNGRWMYIAQPAVRCDRLRAAVLKRPDHDPRRVLTYGRERDLHRASGHPDRILWTGKLGSEEQSGSGGCRAFEGLSAGD